MVTGFSFIDLIVFKILIDGGLYKILELQRIIRFIKKQEFVSLEYISFKFIDWTIQMSYLLPLWS